jgi:hypothetical protein
MTHVKKVDLLASNYVQELEKYINRGYAFPKLYCKDKDMWIKLKKSEKSEKSNKEINPNKVREEIVEIIEYFLNTSIAGGCFAVIRFDENTLSDLKKLLLLANETSGSFNLNKIIDIHNYLNVYELKIDESTMIFGNGDEVYETCTPFNFHTHPISAYEKRGVNVAWPSIQDLKSILENEAGIFHCLISVEGLYFIKKIENAKITKKGLKKYNILYPNPEDPSYFPRTPKEYIKILNEIEDKIFDISYWSWKDLDKKRSISLKVCVE